MLELGGEYSYVISVVEGSPVKATHVQEVSSKETESPNMIDPVTGNLTDPPAESLIVNVEPLLSPHLGKNLTPRPRPEHSRSTSSEDQFEGFTFGLVSPGVQEKISQIEGANKRKSELSPETSELTRKEKKIMREEEKRQKKLGKKHELKEIRQGQALSKI